VMRHAKTGTDSLRSTVGEAAKWTVAEKAAGSAPMLRKWLPFTWEPGDEK
jgi:hypothetical protein